MPGGERLQRIAETLNTTTDFLLGRTDNPSQVRSEVEIAPIPDSIRQSFGSNLRDNSLEYKGQRLRPLPVLGTGYCDDLRITGEQGKEIEIERFMLEVDHVVHMVERPAALAGSPDAYAIYFHGSSMEPRFFQGEMGIVDPRRPASPNDFVVVQLTDGKNDSIQTVLVKQLIRVGAGFVELRQTNPELTFRIDRKLIARMHRICNNNDLYG